LPFSWFEFDFCWMIGGEGGGERSICIDSLILGGRLFKLFAINAGFYNWMVGFKSANLLFS
jgi:hypothetical protein